MRGWRIPAASLGADTELHAQPERIEQHIMELSAFGKNPEGGVSRLAFSQADLERTRVYQDPDGSSWSASGVDAVGNIIGYREGSENLPPIMLGSHIDSVPGGGNYDGNVGVIGAIEVAQVLHDNAVTTRHPLEVVVFRRRGGWPYRQPRHEWPTQRPSTVGNEP